MGIIVVERHDDGATGELGRGSGERRPRELDVARVEDLDGVVARKKLGERLDSLVIEPLLFLELSSYPGGVVEGIVRSLACLLPGSGLGGVIVRGVACSKVEEFRVCDFHIDGTADLLAETFFEVLRCALKRLLGGVLVVGSWACNSGVWWSGRSAVGGLG